MTHTHDASAHGAQDSPGSHSASSSMPWLVRPFKAGGALRAVVARSDTSLRHADVRTRRSDTHFDTSTRHSDNHHDHHNDPHAAHHANHDAVAHVTRPSETLWTAMQKHLHLTHQSCDTDTHPLHSAKQHNVLDVLVKLKDDVKKITHKRNTKSSDQEDSPDSDQTSPGYLPPSEHPLPVFAAAAETGSATTASWTHSIQARTLT
ncbi:hypothetical protein HDU98_008596, partial [Podochytrium sp. JEL0797]